MNVTAIKADGFKNLKNVIIRPHPKYNLITGLNAQGKTNLLESIWLMTGCRSFRGTKDRDCISINENHMDIGLRFDDGRREQKIEYKLSRENIKKKDIKLNGVPIKGTSGIFEQFKAVLFTPDDINIIKGPPEKRRSFIDLCCSQLKPKNIDIVRKLYLIIEHRNDLLKLLSAGKGSLAELDAWDAQLSVYGTLISKKRCEYVKRLSEASSELYSFIAGENEKLTIEYESNIYGNSEKNDIGEKINDTKDYFFKLKSAYNDDLRLGHTVFGAHRDDILIKINGMSVKDFGSQGQIKTAALAIKLGQAEIYYKKLSQAPVILLDDVMGELDKKRQRLVFEIIKDMQVFITACNEESILDEAKGKIFKVEKGRIE